LEGGGPATVRGGRGSCCGFGGEGGDEGNGGENWTGGADAGPTLALFRAMGRTDGGGGGAGDPPAAKPDVFAGKAGSGGDATAEALKGGGGAGPLTVS